MASFGPACIASCRALRFTTSNWSRRAAIAHRTRPEHFSNWRASTWPRPRASCRTRVAVITTRSSPEPALSTRDHSVIFEQVGGTGCAGPLSGPPALRVLLYSPDANWLTQVNLP